MDYHSLSRKQLQALCKKHEIPANLTNLQMADALAALLNVEAAKGGKKQSATGRDDDEKPVLTEISNVPKLCTRSKKGVKAVEEERLEEQPQSTDSEGDGGAKTGKTRTRVPPKAGLKTGKGDEVVEEAVKTRRGVFTAKTSVISAPEVNVEVVEQKVGNNKKKKSVLVNEVVKEKVEEPAEIEQGLQNDLSLQHGRRNPRNPRKKAELVKQPELNVGGAAEENSEAEATSPCKKTVRTRAGKVTHEVDSRSVTAKKSSVRVSDGDEENMTKATELSSDNGSSKPHKAAKSPIIIDLVDDSDEEEEGSEEQNGDGSVHNTSVVPAEKATAAEHRKEGDKIMPTQRTLRGRQANASVVEGKAKLSESSKDTVICRVQKGGKKELVVEACAEGSKSIEADASVEATVNPPQSPKQIATRRGRRGGQKEEVVVNACTSGKVNVVDVSVEAPSNPVGSSLETTANLSQSPQQIVTRRSKKAGQKKGVAVSASVEEDTVNVVDVSVEATADPVDASLEETANLSQSPKQVVTRRSRKVGLKKEVAMNASAEEDKVNVVDISAKATSDPVEASLEPTTNLSRSPEQIVTRRSRKAGQTEEVAVSASAEEDRVNAVDVSDEATADPFESSKQVVTRRGRKGGQKNDENKNGTANPAEPPKQVVACRGKKGGQKELVVNASAEEDRVSAADVSGSLKQEITCKGRKGAQKDDSVLTKNEAANPFQCSKQVLTRRGRKGAQKEELEVNADTKEGKVNAGHVSIEATINCVELPKQVVTRRGCKGGQKSELAVTKMVEKDKSKVVDVPVEVVTGKGQKGRQKELEVDSSVERDKTIPGEEAESHEDHEPSSFEAAESHGMEKMAHPKNSERKIHGPKIETRRTCQKQGIPETEGHKKANIVKASDEKQRQSSSDTDAKETMPTQDLQRKARVSKSRNICGKQDGADIEYPAKEKSNIKESHQKALPSRRTAIRRDLKPVRVGNYEEVNGGEALVNNQAMEEVGSGERNIQRMVENEPDEMGVVGGPVGKDLKPRGKSIRKPSMRGSQSTTNGAEQKVVAEKKYEDLAHEDNKVALVDESGGQGVSPKEVKAPIVDMELAEMFESRETVIIQNVPVQSEEHQKKPGKPAEDGIHMDERINMENEEGVDAATCEKLVFDSETNFKEAAVELELPEIHEEEQDVIKPISPTDTGVAKDTIHMYERRNMKDEEAADAATSEKLDSLHMDNESNLKEFAVELEESNIYDEEQQIIKPVSPTDTAFVKDAIQMPERRNMQDEEGADAATSEKLGSVCMVNEANFKESSVELEETKIHDEEQQIIQAVAPKYLEKDSDPELIDGYKPKAIEVGNDLKHCQSVIEVSSTIIQVEDRLDSSSLTEQADSQFIYNHEVQDKGLPGLVNNETMYVGSSCTAETDETIENKGSVAGESLTDTDVDSQDDSLSECYEPFEEELKAANGINEEQISESDSHREYEGHGMFADASHLKEEDNEDTDDEDESQDLSITEETADEEKITEEEEDEEEDNKDTDDEDESHDLSIAEETADEEKITEEEEDEEEDNEGTDDEDESHDLDIAEETTNEDAITEEEEDNEDTDDEDESHDLDIAEETVDEVKITEEEEDNEDTGNGDESHDLDIAEETADEEKITDSIAGNWDEVDQSELLHKKQDLEILPQQVSYSEARDGEECTIQNISAICVQQNPISLVNDEAHENGLNDSETNEGYHDSVVQKQQQSEQVSKSETHDAQETISLGNQSELLCEKQALEILPQQASYNKVQDGKECTIQQNSISLVNDEAHEYGLNGSEIIEGYHDSLVEKEEEIEQVSKSETHDVEETISHQNNGFPRLSDAVCLKVEDHQLVLASNHHAQEASENIRVSDVDLPHHNAAIKDETHEGKFYCSDNDEQFYGLDDLCGSEVDTLYSMSELVPSLSQHAGESADYKVDVIHVHTQTESDTATTQLSYACISKETEADTAEEIVDSSISFEDSNDVFTSSGMDESVHEREADTAEETVHTSINFKDSIDVFPCSGMTDSVLETEAGTASVNFDDSNDVFPHSGMDDSVLEKLPEILTEEACKHELSQLHTPSKTPVITEGYNISPCLITLFGMDCSAASKRTDLRHCDMEESPVSNIDLHNSPLLADTYDRDESHDLDIAEEIFDEEKIAVSIGGIQKGNLLVQDQVDENQSVDSGSSLQNDNVLFEHEANDQESNEFANYEECATVKNIFVSNGLLQNDSLLLEKSCQVQSMNFSSNQEFQSSKLNLDAGNWNEGDRFELLPENEVLEIPAQQTSYSEAEAGKECSKEYISASYDVLKNHISLVNDDLEYGLNDSKIIEGYEDSVVEKEEQIEQFLKSETQDAQETVSPKNYDDDQNDLHLVHASYVEAQEAVKDEAREDKLYYSDNSEELNGSMLQKEKDGVLNEAHEGESMDCSSTPELKNKLKFDADNLNGAHQIGLLPKNISLENLSQLASYGEAQEPGECSKEEISVLDEVQQSHISLVNDEAQEDKLSDSKTSEGFHDFVYEKEDHSELASMGKSQDAEEIISPKIYNGNQNDDSPDLLDAVENVQASEFCLQYCNSVTKDEAHQDNFSTPQKEEDVVEQISKNETGDVLIPLTEGDQVEYGSYSVGVEKIEVEDRACQESSSIADGITDGSHIKEQLFDMENNGEHKGFIGLPDKIEGKEDDQEEQPIQNKAEEAQKCKVGENIQLVKVDTVASNQEPSGLDTPFKMAKLTEGLDISPCLNSLFGLDSNDDVFHCSGIDDSVPQKSPDILTKEACKQDLSQLDSPLNVPQVTEGYNISPCLSTLFGLDSSIPSKKPELRNSYKKDVCETDLAYQQLSLDTPLKKIEHAPGHDISPCLYTLFGPEYHTPVKKPENTENNVMLPSLQVVSGEQNRDVTSTSFEDALQQRLVTEHLLPKVSLGDHVSLMCAPVFEGTEQSKSILRTEKPLESGEVAEGATILADLNGPSKGDSKSTKLADRILTLSNRLQTLQLDLQLPESFYASPSRKQINSKGTGSTKKTRDPMSVYRPRQSIGSDEAMHSSRKGNPTDPAQLGLWKLQNLHKETEANDSEKVMSKQPGLQNLSLNALEQRVESLDTPLKMLEHTEGHDISPCLYTFGTEYNTPLKNHELTENTNMSPCLQILFGEQYRDVTDRPFEDALHEPLVTERVSPEVSLGYHVSLMDKDAGVFEETEQSKLMLDMQGQLPELSYVTPSRKQMNSKGIGSEKKTRDPMSVYRPRQSIGSDKALHSSMKENPTGLAQFSLRKLRSLCKENETKAKDSEKVMSKRPALQNLSSNALERRLESLDTPLKTLEHTEGHDISPCLYTLFGPEYNTPLKKPELTENNDISPCLQILFGEQYRDVTGTSFEDVLQQPLVTEPGQPEDKDACVFEGTEQSKCMQLDSQGQLPVQQPPVTGPEQPEVQFGYRGYFTDNNVRVFEGQSLDLQGQLRELCYVTPSRKQMNSKGIASAKKTRDPMSVNRPRPSIDTDKATQSCMKENPTDLGQLSLRQLRNLYKEKETKAKDSEKVLSKRPALQNLSSNALEQRVESVGYSPRPFPLEGRFQILEEDCS